MFDAGLISYIKKARKVAVLTGAGVSAESGVPTFRGEEGIWQKFKPEELANFDAFMKNPDRVWEWYSMRKKMMSEVQPNAGHFALAKMEGYFPEFTLITQNIDNLHREAGSRNILELHGNIRRNYCVDCRKFYGDEDLLLGNKVPRCTCGGMIRPDVVWFGEMLPQEVLNAAFRAAENSEVFFSIGTSAVVYPAAMLPVAAYQRNALLIEINPDETPITEVAHHHFSEPFAKALPDLVRAMGIES